MIIFLNGSINSGKTTISKLLSKEMEKVAVVEIDSLRDFIANMELEESIPINLENAILIIKNFVAHGYNVIVPYPLSEQNYKFMINGLHEAKDDVFCFTLSPSIEKALSDTKERNLTAWEKERIQHHYSIGIQKPNFGEIIDTTNQTPEETVKSIISLLNYSQTTK